MKYKKSIIASFAIVLVFFLAVFVITKDHPKIDTNISTTKTNNNTSYIKIAGQTLAVDLAITPAEQERGLSGRPSLEKSEGMLFVFDKPGNYGFWMKDMNFPIDMIWLGEDMRVIYIKKDARPESYPEVYGPSQEQAAAKYVLEVASGFSEDNNLKVGDIMEISH